MILPGLRINDSTAVVAKTMGIPYRVYENIPCNAKIVIDTAILKHEGINNNYKPYLHIVGSVVALKSNIDGEIYTFTFDKKKMLVNYFYKFSQPELVELVEKNYFSNGFERPNMEGFELNLDLDCDLTFLEHEDAHSIPIVFIEINNQEHIDIDRSCGYTLVDKFHTPHMDKPIEKEKSNDLGFEELEFMDKLVSNDLEFESMEESKEDKSNNVEFDDSALYDFEVGGPKSNETIAIGKYKEELVSDQLNDKWNEDPFEMAERSAEQSMPNVSDLKQMYEEKFKDSNVINPTTNSKSDSVEVEKEDVPEYTSLDGGLNSIVEPKPKAVNNDEPSFEEDSDDEPDFDDGLYL